MGEAISGGTITVVPMSLSFVRGRLVASDQTLGSVALMLIRRWLSVSASAAKQSRPGIGMEWIPSLRSQ